MPDSPVFTEADATAFRRMLDTAEPTQDPRDHVTVAVDPEPDSGTPGPPDDGGHGGGGCEHTMVAVTLMRGQRQVSATAILHEPLEDGELQRAARACAAGAIAQLADYDSDTGPGGRRG